MRGGFSFALLGAERPQRRGDIREGRAPARPTAMAISASVPGRSPLRFPAPAPSSRGGRGSAKGRKKPAGSLVVSMPAIRIERTRIAILDLREGLRDHRAGRRIVPAVEPDVGAVRRELDERAGAQPLHARRPVGGGEAGLDRRRRKLDAAPPGASRPRARHSRPGARRRAAAAAGRAGRLRPGRRAGRARRCAM